MQNINLIKLYKDSLIFNEISPLLALLWLSDFIEMKNVYFSNVFENNISYIIFLYDIEWYDMSLQLLLAIGHKID